MAERSAPRVSPPVVWHLRWRKVTGSQGLIASGPNVFLAQKGAGRGGGLLLDTATGARREIAPPAGDCARMYAPGVLMGGGSLMIACSRRTGGPDVELYSLTKRTWTVLDWSNVEKRFCQSNGGECMVEPVGVGTRWIEFALTFTGPESSTTWGFENLRTKAWRHTSAWVDRGDGPGATMPGLNARTMVDLNSPSLLVPVCSPIRLPHNGDVRGRSPILIYGHFALLGFPFSAERFNYLERCGEQQRRPLSSADAAGASGNARVLMWNLHGDRLDGILLASGRKVRAPGPTPTYPCCRPPILTPQDAFVITSGVWEARLPSTGR